MPRPHLGPTAPAGLLTVLLTASLGIPATGAPGGAPAGPIAPAAGEEAVTLPGPTTLRALPSPLAAEVARLPAGTGAVVLERHGPWVRLQVDDVAGWAPETAVGAGATGSAARLDRALLADRPAVAAVLDAARRALGPDGRGGRLGPFALLTDVADAGLLDYLGRVADHVPAAFSRRYGLQIAGADPPGPRRGDQRVVHPVLGTVVLFARDAEYRDFAHSLSELTGDPLAPGELASFAGQAVPEIAALTVQGSPPTDVAHTLIHEATHLLVGRTLGHTVPLWLDEGLAGALELERIDRRGRLFAGPLRARPGGLGVRGRLEGPLAALAGLLADARRGRLERLDELLALERIDLYRSPRRRELYALTALWVRYLLEGEGGEHAPRFRAWLAAAADDPPLLEGAADGTASLPDRLGRTPEELDRGFRIWLHDLASRLGLAR